jgi:hypothetical protein
MCRQEATYTHLYTVLKFARPLLPVYSGWGVLMVRREKVLASCRSYGSAFAIRGMLTNVTRDESRRNDL